MTLTSAASGRGVIAIGDSEGFVHLLDRSMHIDEFRAYEFTLSHMFQMRTHSLLITVGVSCCSIATSGNQSHSSA